jgi:hypothetical protein
VAASTLITLSRLKCPILQRTHAHPSNLGLGNAFYQSDRNFSFAEMTWVSCRLIYSMSPFFECFQFIGCRDRSCINLSLKGLVTRSAGWRRTTDKTDIHPTKSGDFPEIDEVKGIGPDDGRMSMHWKTENSGLFNLGAAGGELHLCARRML